MKLPKSIKPCPIIEAVIELRFSTNEPDDAIFGIIHKEIKEDYRSVQKLPILNLPEAIRANQSNLKYAPYYQFFNENYYLNVGPRVISIIKKEPYNGWEIFSRDAKSIFDKINRLGIVKNIERLGLRYTNFFNINIYDKVDLELTIKKQNFIHKDTYIKNIYEISGHNVILQLGNNSSITKENNVRFGSILDVDVSLGGLPNEFLINPDETLNGIHNVEKEAFFGLLKDEYIQKLNPQY